jgi:putative membrane protein
MLTYLFARLVAVAVALPVTAWILPGISVSGGPVDLLGIAVLFGVVNLLVGPVLRLASFPVNVATLGLFTLVINGVLLAIVAGLSSHLGVSGLVAAIVGALVLGVVATLVDVILGRAFFSRARASRKA